MKYVYYRNACSISLVDSVIITGGGYTRNIVSRYSRDGWVEDLPSLKVGRSSHGCSQYLSGGEQVRLTISIWRYRRHAWILICTMYISPQVLLVTGGYGDGSSRLDSTEFLRPGSDWQEITSARLPRDMYGVRVTTTVDNRVLLFGECRHILILLLHLPHTDTCYRRIWLLWFIRWHPGVQARWRLEKGGDHEGCERLSWNFTCKIWWFQIVNFQKLLKNMSIWKFSI